MEAVGNQPRRGRAGPGATEVIGQIEGSEFADLL